MAESGQFFESSFRANALGATEEPVVIAVGEKPADREITRRALRELGYEKAQAVKRAGEALGMIESGIGDILIIDAEGADMDGYAALPQLKGNEETDGVPVIFFSAMKTASQIIRAREAGVEGCIVKPITAGAVINQLEGAAGGRRDAALKYREAAEKQIVQMELSPDREKEACRNIYLETLQRLEWVNRIFPFHVPVYVDMAGLLIKLGSGGRAASLLRLAGGS